ncbi:MAG: prepilin-type N-terminal cleavage/methylation domain-containing protein [Candidatus Omnitrophota bacterium]|nr:prepilin-type N-terminal cleavage/methylation domain-containing protein [Candidatus Omnitrophota bacterium]
MKRGFTLLELIVVIIVIGILAALGFAQYTTVLEKARTGEAKMILGQIRTAQVLYNQQYSGYTTTIGNLAVDVTTACDSSTYFSYSVGTAGEARAQRCTASSKNPIGPTSYYINLTYTGGVISGDIAKYY